MIATFHRLAILGLCLVLGACNAPRGAGFQSEVLAAHNTTKGPNGEPVYDFSVFPVTRASLPVLNAWPVNKTRSYAWINHTEQPASLMIAPGDMLSITIFDAEENSLLTGPGQRVVNLQSVPVGSDGRIFLPFVGNMKVSGMAPDTARQRIQDTLINTVPSAQVLLNVEPGRGNTANLVSGVRAPGVYPLPDRNVSLLSLLSLGGGVDAGLSNPQVRLFRGNRTYGISLDRLFDEPALDTTIQGGDRVLIEADERYFLSLGATTTESLHPFPKEKVSALDAMSIVGGLSDARANPQGILILREYPASALRPGAEPTSAGPPQDRVVFTIDLTRADGLFSAGNFMIQPGDLVYATESPLGASASVLSIFGAALVTGQRLGL
jgi:polysaccharide export outer membrane protein